MGVVGPPVVAFAWMVGYGALRRLTHPTAEALVSGILGDEQKFRNGCRLNMPRAYFYHHHELKDERAHGKQRWRREN